MTTPSDPDRAFRAFLDEGPVQLPGRSYDAVRARVDRTRQRVVLGTAKEFRRQAVAPLAIAAAAVLVVVVAGATLFSSRGDVGNPAAPTALPSSPPPLATLGADPEHPIEAGSFVLSTPRARVHLTMPAGWSGDETGVSLFLKGWTDALGLNPIGSEISYVLADACADEADVDLVEVGPTVEDLTTALANQTGIQRSGPIDVMLGGYPATRFVLTLLPACPVRNGIWADASRTYGRNGLRHGETATVHVVDVNGDRLVIWSAYAKLASAEHIAQLEAITASIEIEPAPNAGPLPALVDHGWLPTGRHVLAVDEIGLSFNVPPLVPDQGWSRYRDIYISKDTVGPQAAEGAVYWTAFPEGADTDLCPNLQSLPRDASAADLAAAVAAAPGTELVTAPTDVIIGGRPAKHVVLTVREDLGCDPGFFFTWDPAWGGPGWWWTNVGDTIRVWIADVDGTLLFIAGETTPDAGPRTKQEILDIVDSIQFE